VERDPSTTVRNSLPRGWTWGVFIPQGPRNATVVERPICVRKGNVSTLAAFFLPPNSPAAGTAVLKSKMRFFLRSSPDLRTTFLASGSSGLVAKRIFMRSTAVTLVRRSSASCLTSLAFAAAAEAAAASTVMTGAGALDLEGVYAAMLMLVDLETMVLIVLDERLAELGSGLLPVQESGPRAGVPDGAGAALTAAVAARAMMRVLNIVDMFAGLLELKAE
jgi:hypothetical protein